jgi:beta-glucanase (GH16 family)
VPLSEVEPIDVPVADVDNQANQNIDNPTLNVPATFQVSDGDLLTLVWSDEFDGAALDPEVWFFESGDGSQYGFGENGTTPGWGNNELQYYLPDNAQLVNGVLEITARRESVDDYNFTSARINTQDRFAFKYGRIEASIKFPSGQGLWPAFWMLSQDSPYGEWAATGEIDVVEAVNLDGTGGNEVFATIHFGGDAALGQNTSSETRYTPSFDVTEDFHTYAFEWDEFEMRWYIDGTLYKVENFWSSTAAAYPAPFDQPFHILFNLAVGGNFPGSPDGTTPSPATLSVDWVRVYSGEAPPIVPADPGTIPDVKLYDRGGNPDLVFGVDYGNIVTFSSGADLEDNYTGDADFSPALSVTTGFGYDKWNAQLAYIGFAAGFATGYETLDFKVKGLSGDVIRVKFLDSPDYLDINVASSAYSTALGNGWYQVSVPIGDFSAVDTATGLLFETIEPAPAASFRYLLTDIGFSGTAGGGGGGGTVLATFDEAVPPAVTFFGAGASGATDMPGPAGGDGNALRINRNNGNVYDGAWVAVQEIPNDAGDQTISALVYSPLAGIPIVTKVEYADNSGTGDVQANETVVVGWQTLTWTYTNLAPGNVYNRFSILPNLGVADMPAQDYFFDNITLLDAGGGWRRLCTSCARCGR